ncbi:hypothetical protein PUN28_017206 [Cardiocondyla obscurior]
MENSLDWAEAATLEQSPILGKKLNLNRNLHMIKKKSEENIFKDVDFNKTKQFANSELKHVQKEDACKRKLFQNDKELETSATTSIQIFDDSDVVKENKKETEQLHSKNSKNSSCDPLSCYTEFCKRISAENFESDILPNFPTDPLAKTLKKLKHTYTDSFRQQLLRKKKKQELENVKPADSTEYQTTSPELSPVEFEVPACRKNYTIDFQEDPFQKNDKLRLMQNAKLKKSNDITHHNSASCSSRNIFTACNEENFIVENCKNNDTQHSQKPKDSNQFSESMNFYLTNNEKSVQLSPQKNSKYVGCLSPSNQYDRNNFLIDISGCKNSPFTNNSKQLFESSMFLNNSKLFKKHFLKESHEELLDSVSDKYSSNDQINEKHNRKTINKYDVKNVKRIPTILRRYGNVIDNKSNHSAQITDNYKNKLYTEYETNLLNTNLNNSFKKKLFETSVPNVLKNLPPTSTMIFNQSKILGPQIETMQIKDSQESQVDEFDVNIHSKERNGRNKTYRYDSSCTCAQKVEVTYNTNAYSEKLPQREQISPIIKTRGLHSNNCRQTNLFQDINFSNSNVEPTKEYPQRTKLHVCETDKRLFYRKDTRHQNQSIPFANDGQTIPTPMLNHRQNIQADQKPKGPCQKSHNLHLFDKTDVKCAENKIKQDECHHCNEQYLYFDSANCSRRYKEQAHYFKEISQPQRLCNTRSYNNDIDNCVNLPSNVQNVSVLPLQQQNNLYAYPQTIDNQHRAVLMQSVTQPVKYLAVKNGSNIQRVPVYINDKNVRVVQNVPLNVITLMDQSTQAKTFPQEIATQMVPLETNNNLQFNDFATCKVNDQTVVKGLNSVNAILLQSDSESKIWYASNL